MFPTYFGSGQTWNTHALLRSPIGDIDVLPDHAHESECLVGNNLGAPYTDHGLNLIEFPSVAGAPLEPVIVARSVSAGRFLIDSFKPPTTPRVFGAISAWDGHRVAKGRIVCDATWHHFVNINLDGTGAGPDPLLVDPRRGLRDSAGDPTEDFTQVANYYRNIVDWLIPATRRWCSIFEVLVDIRYRFPLFEEFIPLPDPHPCPWDPRVDLGTSVDAALTALKGRGYTDDLVIGALDLAGVNRLADHLRPQAADEKRQDPRSLLRIEELRRGIVGSIADALLRDLPANPHELEEALTKIGHDDKRLESLIASATKDAVVAATDHFKQSVDSTFSILG